MLFFYRPTIVPELGEEAKNWTTVCNLHLDMNPWGYMDEDNEKSGSRGKRATDEKRGVIEARDQLNYEKIGDWISENNRVIKADGLSVQGLINLADNYAEDGGFQCVPGFHHQFEDFFKSKQPTKSSGRGPNNSMSMSKLADSSYDFDRQNELNGAGIRISMRPGSLLIWDQRLPHGSLSNYSTRFRSAQFLKMFPRRLVNYKRGKYRSQVLLDFIKTAKRSERVPGSQTLVNNQNDPLEITDIGRKIFGLDSR